MASIGTRRTCASRCRVPQTGRSSRTCPNPAMVSRPLISRFGERSLQVKLRVKDPVGDAWLVDGMAQFASLLYFERTLSPAEAQTHIHTALVKALGYEGNTTVRQAGSLDKDTPEYHSLVQYKGAYIFRMLKWVIGDENFDKLLARYDQQLQSTPVSTETFEKQ